MGWAEWSNRGTKQIAGVQPAGGFLPNPSLLNPGGAGQADLVYRSPTANFASYNKVILEPVAVWAPPDSPLNTVPVEQRQVAANAFYSDLYNALSRRCQMVTLHRGVSEGLAGAPDRRSCLLPGTVTGS